MKSFIRAIVLSCAFLVFLFFSGAPLAQERPEILFFYSPTCPHCTKEKSFLDDFEVAYPEVEVKRFEASDNISYLKELYHGYEVPEDIWGWVPVTFVQQQECESEQSEGCTFVQQQECESEQSEGCTFVGQYFLGFDTGTDREIEVCVLELLGEDPQTSRLGLMSEDSQRTIRLPIIGEIDVSKTGLLVFSALIGIVDGFNACAMWALCFLLTFLVASGSRKRIFLIGSTFILVSGLVYFLFISAWLSLFLVIGYMKIIQAVISVLAVIFGLVCIKDFFAFGKGITFILPKATRDKIVERMAAMTDPRLALPATLAGVALLAAGVNMVELLCTTGFPAVFTKILSVHQLPSLSYYLYLSVYILFYMLDDFLIFSVVVSTLGARQFPDKYKRLSKLISGLIILALGLIMLLRPELLVFG